MSTAALVLSFQCLTLLGSALTALKLFSTGLYKRYRIFFAYFALVRLPYGVLVLYFTHSGTQSPAYYYFFIYSEPVIILFYILVVLELYRLVLERYKGLYTLGRWAMYLSVVVAGGISLLLVLVTPTARKVTTLAIALYTERGVDLALVVFIILILLFLSRYPVPLSRNVVVHTGIYSVFYLSTTFGLLMWTIRGKAISGTVNVCLIALAAVCSFTWWLFLSDKGEEVQVSVPQMSPGAEDRILQQLADLNATLMKVSRK